MVVLDVLAVGVQRGHVCLEHHVDEDRQEVVGARPRGIVVPALEVEDGEDDAAALDDAVDLITRRLVLTHPPQLVLRRGLG